MPKPATISDLFTPMQSIQTCMENNTNAIKSGVETLNESVLGCTASMSTVSKVFKKTVETSKSAVVASINDLKKTTEKSIKNAATEIAKSMSAAMSGVAAASAAAASASAAPMSMIGESMQQNAVAMANTYNELVSIGKDIKQLKKDLKKSGKEKRNVTEKLKEGAAPKKEESAPAKKGKFQGLKDLGEAASTFSEISMKDAILMKSKVQKVLEAAKEMEDFGKDFDAENAEGLAKTLATLGKSAMEFTASLGSVAILAPFAALTAKLLVPTISSVAEAVEPIADADEDEYKGISESLEALAQGTGKFMAYLALGSVLAPFAMVTALLMKPTVGLMVKALEPISGNEADKYNGASETLEAMATGSLKFLASMALSVVLAPVAMVGAGLFALLLLETRAVFGIMAKKETTRDMRRASNNLEKMGGAALMFEATMALSTILAPVAMVGVALSTLVIGGSATLFNAIGNRRTSRDIRQGVLTLELMSIGILGYTLSLLATTMILRYLITGGGEKVDWMNIVAVASALPMFGVMVGSAFLFSRIGDSSVRIAEGSLAVMIMGAATVMFTLSLLATYMITKSMVGDVFKDGKFDMKNVAALACILPVFGLMLGANAVFKRIGNEKSVKDTLMGGLSIIVMSVSLITFAGAMWVTHQMTKSIIGKADKNDIFAVIADVAVLALMLGANYIYRRLGKEKSVQETLAGGLSVVAMSVGLVTFAGAMWVTHQMTKSIIKNGSGADIGALVADVAIFALMLGGNYLFRRLGSEKTVKESMRGLMSIAAMSAGIIAFSGAMWVSHKIAKQIIGEADTASILTTLGIFALMVGSVYLFKFAGSNFKDIAKGAGSMLLMAVGIGAFGYGLSFFTDAVKDAKWWQLLAMPALVLAFGVEFAALGYLVEFVALGAASVALMGASLVPFGWGVGQYAKYLQEANLDWKTVGQMAGLIMLFGVEMSLLGPLSPLIVMSDVAMGVMGLSLIGFGKGVSSYANDVRESKIDWKTLGKMAGLIAVFGAEFALVAPLSPLILMADAAIGVMGASLYSIGVGVGEYATAVNKSKVNVKTILNMAGIIGTFATEFSAIALVSPFIIAGSAAAAAMGGALLSLGKGLQEFAAAKLQPKSIDTFSKMMITLRDTFAVMAGSGEAGGKGGILGTLFRGVVSAISPSSVEKGVEVSRKMGNALYDISKGLLKFQEGIGDKIIDKQFMQDFADSVSTTVSSISSAFRTVGESWVSIKSPEPRTVFGKLFRKLTAGVFDEKTRNSVEEGIKATKGMGSSLAELAKGLKEYKDLVPNEKDAGWVGAVATNIALMLDALVGPLTKFGTVEESVSLVQSQSSNIARGFASIQSSIDNTVNYNSKKVDIARAMENVGQIGTLISGLAQGVKTFAEINPKKDIGSAFEINDDWTLSGNGGGMIGNIQQMLCGFFPAFIQLGKKLEETGTFDEVVEAAKYESHWYGNQKTQDARTEKKSYVGMAIAAAQGIGGIISDLAEGMKSFNEAYPDPSKLATGVGNVIKAISSMFTGFGTIGYAIVNGGGLQPVLPSGAENGFDFGYIHGNVRMLRYAPDGSDMTEVFSSISSSMNNLITGIGESVNKMKGQMPAVNEVNKSMEAYILTLLNLSTAAHIMGDHTAEESAFFYTSKGITTYQMQNMDNALVKGAYSNASEMKNVVEKVVTMGKSIQTIPDSAGKKFTVFTTDLVRGMNQLAATHNNVTAATKFIDSLTKAKNEQVFENIASNTERIAQALNSINNNNLQPYAEMIAGMGKLSESTSNAKKIMDEIRDLIEDMVDKIGELRNGGGGGSDTNGGSNKPTPTNVPQQRPQQPQPVPQQRVKADVSFDQSTLNALSKLTQAINEKF